MSDSVEFLTLCAALYLLECLGTVPPDGLVLDRKTWGGFVVKRPVMYPGTTWGWVLLNPFRPDGPVFSLAPGPSPLDRDRFDVEGIREVCTSLTQHARGLRMTTAFFFLACFGLVPVYLLCFGLRRGMLAAGPVVLLLSICRATLYRRSALLLKPNTSRVEIYGRVFRLVLYPISALRCLDLLSRHLLSAFDPIAVATALYGKAEAARLAAREVAGLKYAALVSESDPQYRAARLQLIEWFSAQQALPLGPLMEPPAPENITCRTYCPACGMQYVLPYGSCSDCPTILLQPLAPARLA